MKYQQLFSLSLRHEYYADQRCLGLAIEPDSATLQLLKNLRCVLQKLPGGLRVLIAVSEQDNPFISLPDETVFGFYLSVVDTAFYMFSDLSGLYGMARPQFANLDGVSLLALAEVPVPDANGKSNGKSAGKPNSLARSVLAGVALRIGQPQAALTATSNPFLVQFAARSYRWLYYVVCAAAANRPVAIVSRDGGIVFQARDLSANPDAADQIGTGLAAQFPAQRIWRLRSDTALTCQQLARSGLALMIDNEKVIPDLPNPALQNLMPDAQQNAGQQDALYQIVKYFTP